MNILLTGGAGFIGSHLLRSFLEKGYHVTVLDNFSSGKRENLKPFEGRFNLVEGSICDSKIVDELMSGVDAVSHHAAIIEVPQTIKEPAQCHEVNINGTVNLLESARRHKVKRFVLASSAAVYGHAEKNQAQAETEVSEMLSPYALSKRVNEEYARLYWKIYGLDTVCLRYFNVFGLGQDPHSPYSAVIPKFIDAARKGEEVCIYGDGEQVRDFVHVSDVVQANVAALEAPASLVGGHVFNVGRGQSTKLIELLHALEQITGKPIARRHEKARGGDIFFSLADISTSRQTLGFEPRVTLNEGLQELFLNSKEINVN
jgi:nucleoside-diphosphate-sugar epimerase